MGINNLLRKDSSKSNFVPKGGKHVQRYKEKLNAGGFEELKNIVTQKYEDYTHHITANIDIIKHRLAQNKTYSIIGVDMRMKKLSIDHLRVMINEYKRINTYSSEKLSEIEKNL